MSLSQVRSTIAVFFLTLILAFFPLNQLHAQKLVNDFPAAGIKASQYQWISGSRKRSTKLRTLKISLCVLPEDTSKITVTDSDKSLVAFSTIPTGKSLTFIIKKKRRQKIKFPITVNVQLKKQYITSDKAVTFSYKYNKRSKKKKRGFHKQLSSGPSCDDNTDTNTSMPLQEGIPNLSPTPIFSPSVIPTYTPTIDEGEKTDNKGVNILPTPTCSVTPTPTPTPTCTETSHSSIPDDVQKKFGANPSLQDTDSDGLDDDYEINNTYPFLNPNSADTDNDGVSDANEDIDEDNLTTLEEIANQTDPLNPDTDGDGIRDGDEVAQGTSPIRADTDNDKLTDKEESLTDTDPLNPDTDSDGILDGDDTVDSISETDGAVVVLKGKGFLAKQFRAIHFNKDSYLNKSPGIAGDVFDFNLDEAVKDDFEKATITLPYNKDSENASDTSNLKVFTFNEELKHWVPVEGRHLVDTNKGTVTTEVDHFSLYAVFNFINWQGQVWDAVCIPRRGDEEDDSDEEAFNPVDVMLVIDSSGSMTTNDPDDLRKVAASNFVSALVPQDKVGVVDFDENAVLLASLTENLNSAINAISNINSEGLTDIGAGVSLAIQELLSKREGGRGQIIILLTDGVGDYSSSLTNTAINNGIIIYTIGLGEDVDSSLLQGIASATNGVYNFVADAQSLPRAFRDIKEDIGDPGVDTDGDGLTDCEETSGMQDKSGIVFYSDPEKADTDGDGLDDGDEIGEWTSLSTVNSVLQTDYGQSPDDQGYYDVYSDPYNPDTDSDGLSDGQEADIGTLARELDSDSDGISDSRELAVGTEALLPDTDGDSFNDLFELSNINDGYDPTSFTVITPWWVYTRQFSQGFVLGDFNLPLTEFDTVPYLLGTITSGFSVPGVSDIRDALGSLFNLDYIGVGINVAGVLPVAGDAVSAVSKVGKFVLENAGKADEVVLAIAKNSDWLPGSIAIASIKQGLGETSSRIAKNISDENLARVVKKGARRAEGLAEVAAEIGDANIRRNVGWVTPENAENILRQGRAKPKKHWPFVDGDPEQTLMLKEEFYKIGEELKGAFNIDGFKGGRVPDDILGGVARESKAGYVRNNKAFRTQVAKDVALRKMGQYTSVEWHIFANDSTNNFGITKSAFELLKANGINVILNFP